MDGSRVLLILKIILDMLEILEGHSQIQENHKALSVLLPAYL